MQLVHPNCKGLKALLSHLQTKETIMYCTKEGLRITCMNEEASIFSELFVDAKDFTLYSTGSDTSFGVNIEDLVYALALAPDDSQNVLMNIEEDNIRLSMGCVHVTIATLQIENEHFTIPDVTYTHQTEFDPLALHVFLRKIRRERHIDISVDSEGRIAIELDHIVFNLSKTITQKLHTKIKLQDMCDTVLPIKSRATLFLLEKFPLFIQYKIGFYGSKFNFHVTPYHDS